MMPPILYGFATSPNQIYMLMETILENGLSIIYDITKKLYRINSTQLFVKLSL